MRVFVLCLSWQNLDTPLLRLVLKEANGRTVRLVQNTNQSNIYSYPNLSDVRTAHVDLESRDVLSP